MDPTRRLPSSSSPNMRLPLAAAGIALALHAGVAFAYVPPANDGYVTDAIGLLTVAEEQALEGELSRYADETSNGIAVLIVNDIQGEAIADVAIDVLRQWGVGDAKKNNGIVILFKQSETLGDRELFIVTGYGLEGVIPDIVARGIIEREIVPRFQHGEYAEGFHDGIAALQKHIGGEYTADRYAQTEDGWEPFLLFFLFAFGDAVAAYMGRTKSWWFGGILGCVFGVVLTVLYAWWISIPALVAIGLVLDYWLSQAGYGSKQRWRGGRGGGGFWSGGTGGFGGGGGLSGFGGGSTGGGGAGMRW